MFEIGDLVRYTGYSQMIHLGIIVEKKDGRNRQKIFCLSGDKEFVGQEAIISTQLLKKLFK